MVEELEEEIVIHEDEYYYNIVRKNIRYFRLKKNLTQQKLADRIGMSRDYVCDIENESRNKHPTIAVLGRIADALKINIANLFIIRNDNNQER